MARLEIPTHDDDGETIEAGGDDIFLCPPSP